MTTNSSTELEKDDPPVQFNVRLPYSLLKTLEHYATETSRSKNKSAIYLIQQALKNEGYI